MSGVAGGCAPAADPGAEAAITIPGVDVVTVDLLPIVVSSLIGQAGKIGAAGDPAVMESFFALLQLNVMD